MNSKIGGDSDSITRRELFGAASLAAAGLSVWGTAEATAAAAQRAPGKHEPLENFKYDIEASEGWVGEAGSAKEANVSEFPVSKSMAGVSMRLKPGGLRELHWHAVAAEWAYVIEGNVRTTVIAPNGQAESSDFGPGDVWYFPKGHGHALQCLGPGDAHFVLVFDSGYFSEFGTFSITDWVGHTPAARGCAEPGTSGVGCGEFAETGVVHHVGKSAAADARGVSKWRSAGKSVSAQVPFWRDETDCFPRRRAANRIVARVPHPEDRHRGSSGAETGSAARIALASQRR